MSDKIITEIVLEDEKEAIASIQRVGKATDATFADLKNDQLNFESKGAAQPCRPRALAPE